MRPRHAALAALLVAAAPAATAQGAPPSVDALHWLSGCWHAEDQEAGSMEAWLPPAGGTLVGIGRTVRGGRTVGVEVLRIEAGPDGRLALTAAPDGQPPATFTATRVAADEVVFENPAHDFPQRIRYRTAGPDALVGRIEGVVDGAPRAVDFPFVRERCGAGG